MPIRRRTLSGPTLPHGVLHLLQFGELSRERKPGQGQLTAWQLLVEFNRRRHPADPCKLHDLWRSAGNFILAEWIRDSPGTRPAAWWWFESPEAQRRRLGGVGHDDAAFDGLQRFSCGIPCLWTLAALKGGRTVDPEDPPQFESEAAFLERHGLLTADERRRLPADAFEPEFLTFESDIEGSDAA